VPRIGLVLGAGGVVGQAYHAGVLAALEHDLGWDPRTADVIVGSSAGSVTGSLLRLGVPAADLAAWAVEAPLSVEGAPLMEQLGGRDADPDFPSPSPLDLLRPWRLPTPALLRRVAARPWAFRPGATAMTMMPAGRIDIAEKAEVLRGHPEPQQRAGDRAGRGADDDVGVRGAPARLGLECLQGADEPRGSDNASCAQDQTDPIGHVGGNLPTR